MRLCCIRAVVFSIKRYCRNIFSITSHSNGFPRTMEKVIEVNNVASATLNDLKAQFACIKSTKNEIRKQQLRIENVKLRQQVEAAKMQLIDLEKRNGKKQIAIPTNCVTTKQPVAKPSPPARVKQENVVDAKMSKEKKPKKPAAAATPIPATSIDEAPVDIGRIDLRIGKIVEIQKHPDADSLYVEQIDLGEDKPRTVVSGLVKHVPIEEMKNRLVVVMCNLKPAKMRGVTSEGMVMCASSPEKVEVLTPPPTVCPGDLVHCENYNRNPDPQLNPKKKIFETVAPDLLTNDQLVACYKGAPLYVPGKGHIKATTLKNVNVR